MNFPNMNVPKQGIVRYGTWRQLAHRGAQCGCVLLFFQWSCAYDDAHDVHNETGSAGRVSRLVTCPISVWMGKVPIRKHTKWPNHTSYRESDGRLWIGKPGLLFKFPNNHTSISFSFGDIRMWQTERQIDNMDQYYSWPPHCGGPANVTQSISITNTFLNLLHLYAAIKCTLSARNE